MTSDSVDINNLRKKLIYRSNYRGCKETDFLLGKFAKEHIPNMSVDELSLYEKFLDEDDGSIYKWLSRKEELPETYKKSDIIIKLLNSNE